MGINLLSRATVDNFRLFPSRAYMFKVLYKNIKMLNETWNQFQSKINDITMMSKAPF